MNETPSFTPEEIVNHNLPTGWEERQTNQATFDYYLGVLPPVSMGATVTLWNGRAVRSAFVFAEGADIPTAFYSDGGEYWMARVRTKSMNERATGWVAAAKTNTWLRNATDPVLSPQSLCFVDSEDALAERLQHGNWALAQGFALGSICFINQVDGGDEWLVLRGTLPFESYTYETRSERDERRKTGEDKARARLMHFLAAVRAATDEQLQSLSY